MLETPRNHLRHAARSESELPEGIRLNFNTSNLKAGVCSCIINIRVLPGRSARTRPAGARPHAVAVHVMCPSSFQKVLIAAFHPSTAQRFPRATPWETHWEHHDGESTWLQHAALGRPRFRSFRLRFRIRRHKTRYPPAHRLLMPAAKGFTVSLVCIPPRPARATSSPAAHRGHGREEGDLGEDSGVLTGRVIITIITSR